MPEGPVGDPLTGEAPARVIERGVSVADPQGENGRAILWADRGWDHLPGSDGAERALVDRVMRKAREAGGAVPREIIVAAPPAAATAMVRAFTPQDVADWLADPRGSLPLAVLPEADAAAIGADSRVAELSRASALKQRREHPDLTPEEYLRIQDVVERRTHLVPDTPHSMIYVLDESTPVAGGYVLVVKATRTGKGLFITSYRRLHRAEAVRDKEIARLLAKGER